MTEQDRESIIATVNGFSREELQVVITCISDELLGAEIIRRLQNARMFKEGIANLLENKIAPWLL